MAMTRGQMFVRGGLTLVVAVAMASVALGGTAGAGTMPTQSVLRSANAAIAAQHGVHVVFVADSGASSARENLVADAGRTGGSESVAEGKATLSVRVNGSFAYVKGSPSGLTSLFGLSSKQAKTLGGNWESWKAGTRGYGNLKADVTLSAVKALLPKVAGTKASIGTVDGSKSYALKWTDAATSSHPTLSNSLTLSASFLPARETTTASDGAKLTTTLSRWGERVQVTTPPAASIRSSSSVQG
jgi:hypothetical protein